MFYQDGKLQYPVRVESPNPYFAKQLQQAIGGVEGEIRVMLQYFFQAFGMRGPVKYRDMLMETATEEIAHVEMLATAVALNLEGAPMDLQQAVASSNGAAAAIMGGMDPRQYLSAGLAALPADANGVPFDCSNVYASGNIAADMYSNVTAEATGRLLATRLRELTDDPGMKDMLSFLIARDTMHQQQWLAVIEELGGYEGVLPIPNTFPQEDEHQEVSYVFVSTHIDPNQIARGRWTEGPSLDGRGEFSAQKAAPRGEKPVLGPPASMAFPEAQQSELQSPRAQTGGSANGQRKKASASTAR
jgi:Mn-containing catalase